MIPNRLLSGKPCSFKTVRVFTGTLVVGFSLSGVGAPAWGKRPEPPKDRDGYVHFFSQEKNWIRRRFLPPLTRDILAQSVEACRIYLLNHQKPEGNFIYLQQYLTGKLSPVDDSQVREAGAVWALTMLCRQRPTIATQTAALRALDYFFRISKPLACGTVAPCYPRKDHIKSNGVALLVIAIIDLLRARHLELPAAGRGFYVNWANKYLEHLENMELGNGCWSEYYSINERKRQPQSNPFVDGECLLAYCMAARYIGRTDLIPKIEKFAPELIQRYIVDAWAKNPDSSDTLQFSQWGCLAFSEYYLAGWKKNRQLIGDAAQSLAWWMLYEHDIVHRRANMGYACEGVIAAWRVAHARKDQAAADSLRKFAERVLARILTYQVGGPFSRFSEYIKPVDSTTPGYGGILFVPDAQYVRIDNVQHQLHAELMALEYFFPDK